MTKWDIAHVAPGHGYSFPFSPHDIWASEHTVWMYTGTGNNNSGACICAFNQPLTWNLIMSVTFVWPLRVLTAHCAPQRALHALINLSQLAASMVMVPRKFSGTKLLWLLNETLIKIFSHELRSGYLCQRPN